MPAPNVAAGVAVTTGLGAGVNFVVSTSTTFVSGVSGFAVINVGDQLWLSPTARTVYPACAAQLQTRATSAGDVTSAFGTLATWKHPDQSFQGTSLYGICEGQFG